MEFYILILALIVPPGLGDIYLHNPRGSNNRLDESVRESSSSSERLFDSQNGGRGGYNVGSVYYYAGSRLPIEWTNQHSCGGSNNHCEIILQYMCADTVRDGSTTAIIPENATDCAHHDCNTDMRYGMHEDYEYYTHCKMRHRNSGLYLADQRLLGHSATYTRQNPDGERRGYECSEEREYYPYWHPSPWKDIAVMTNDASTCPHYQAESENVKGRWACVLPWPTMMAIPNNKHDCQRLTQPDGARGQWVQFPSHGLPAPDCLEAAFSRDNHLGNGVGGYPNVYNWTVPDTIHEHCVMRIRYNITSGDYKAWDGVNATHNDKESRTRLDLSDRYGFNSRKEAESRGYRLHDHPEVQIFPELPTLKHRLAIDTTEYGRTFQDRSHTFAIRPRPSNLDGGNIYNVNVRGKRGNIVQVYPSVEYDYIPNTLLVGVNDYVHFQWTGSDGNPIDNEGEGRPGTDRSNVVLQGHAAFPAGQPGGSTHHHGHWGLSYPELLTNTTFLGLSEHDIMDLALLTSKQFGGAVSLLDDAGTYFDLGPRKVTQPGTYHYFCTRNNNFSNRSQKGRIVCSEAKVEFKAIGWNGGRVAISHGNHRFEVMVKRGVFSKLEKIQLEQWQPEQVMQKLKEMNMRISMESEGTHASPITVIHPQGRLTVEGHTFDVAMAVWSDDVTIYRTSPDFSTWTRVECRVKDRVAWFSTDRGGVYMAMSHSNTGLIVSTVAGVLVILIVLVGGSLCYFKRYPEKARSLRRSLRRKV